jgi:7-carboxy-7-deazaguanine synthase
MKISEIFWSFQGEGSRAGYPSVFVRLAGCSLECSYCDTKESWQETPPVETKEIVSKIESLYQQYPASQVVITGGEPLEQDLSELVQELKARDYFISIETNGTRFQYLNIDWWTISPKDVTFFTIHPMLPPIINEVKLIVNDNLNVEIIKKIREKFTRDFPIFLQPNHYHQNKFQDTFRLYSECQKMGIKNIRAGFQLHKLYNVQ